MFGSKLAKFVKIKLLLKFNIEISLICPTDKNSFVRNRRYLCKLCWVICKTQKIVYLSLMKRS